MAGHAQLERTARLAKRPSPFTIASIGGTDARPATGFTGVVMKSVLQGFAAAVVIAVLAGVVLNVTGQSSANKFTTANTRL